VAIELLQAALKTRRALGLPSEQTTAYRLVHGAGDGIDGLTVDVYGEYLVASLYTEERGERENRWLEALSKLGFRGIYVKLRPRQANQLAEAERKERAPEQAVFGESAPDAFIVLENGVPYEVRLGDGLSTGLFLDQRDNRARFATLAPGKRVLNLFAYTCAFGLVAARAGAASTSNLDVAKSVLERGKRNYALSGLGEGGEGEHLFLARDALEALPKLARRGVRYDLIALDPPSYASTRGVRFSVERDYDKLVANALAVLEPGGTLLACTNHSRMTDRDLGRALENAAHSVGRRTRSLEFVAPPADHPGVEGRPAHLKSAWVSA
jgi:23S rRNA (cytosine1962-C5)-methyltransferase